MKGELCLKSANNLCGIGTQSGFCPFLDNSENDSDISYNFYIPSFQRGYRWTSLQVEQLVQDLVDFHEGVNKNTESWYCLQPLVVVEEKEKKRWIVIDGQQRLTTLYLILKSLGVQKLYSLEYETRHKSKAFLAEIEKMGSDKADIESNADFACMYAAWKSIKTKLENYPNKESLADTILSRVKFIWYETCGNPYNEFSRMNSGKISLSNAELIKALLLKETLREGKKELSQLEAAREWDYMEQMLHDDDFWCFINPTPTDKRFNATHLDFIFEMVLRMNGKNNKYVESYMQRHQPDNAVLAKPESRPSLLQELEKNPYYIFGVFQDYIKEGHKAASEIWQDVQGVFRIILSWYSDRDLFHRIGYLMNRKGKDAEKKLKDLAEWLCNAMQMTKTDFLEMLNEKIDAKRLIDALNSLEYGRDNDDLNNVLLLFNIAIIIRQRQEKSRYPFREHKNAAWTLEHIHAKNERPLTVSDFDEMASWLAIDFGQSQNAKEKVKTLNKKFQRFGEQKLLGVRSLKIVSKEREDKQAEWHFADDKDINGIENLALLGHKANSTYNNSLFTEKRTILVQWLERDREKSKHGEGAGKDTDNQTPENQDEQNVFKESGFNNVEFIPTATIMAFFKQFSQDCTLPFLWTEGDAENYVEAISKTLTSTFCFADSTSSDTNIESKGEGK